MKYSVSSYSYMKMIRAGEITPFEVIAKTKELGFDAIEFVDFVDFLPLPAEERPASAETIPSRAQKARDFFLQTTRLCSIVKASTSSNRSC